HPYLVLKVDWGAVVVESSEDNNTRAVLIQSQPQAPPAPDGIAAQAGDGSVTLLWNSVAGASGYNLYWGTSPGVSRDAGQLIGGVSSPFAHNGLANGVTYYYVVTALAVGLEGGESAEVSATPLAPTQGEGGWNQGLTPMPTGRYAASSATVDGKIYIIGGTSDGYNSLSVVERYDPRTDSWATMAPKPHPNRGGHRAAVVDGMIYVMGGGWGSYTGLMERYDPATDTWQTMPPMPTARSFFAAVAVNGRIYAMGGYNGTYLRTTEIFDPASNTWTTGPILPGSAYGLAACVHQARIYIMGGVSGSNMSSSSLAVLDTTSGQWRTLAPMFESANCMTCQTLNGKIYAFGGWRGGYLENEQDTMVYDPGSNAWSLAAPLPTFRASAESGLVDGVIYVIGGRNKTRYNLDMVEAFTP
ncbi:MAG: hypothetical protein OEZ59_04320, partial [Deltaproteobacteria bacterium]|nr:hypothetical protein [Deltaproteobacteria bacterium]